MEQFEQYKFGLVGRTLPHSFSPAYFKEKFLRDGISNAEYLKWELSDIRRIPQWILSDSRIIGFNVTIPYKEEILAYLDELDPIAKAVGAVNTVYVERKAPDNLQKIPGCFLRGFNTDVTGFRDSVKPLLRAGTDRALVLGTGGSSKAVAYVLKSIGIQVLFVSRKPTGSHQISWADLNEYVIRHHRLIVNTTPLGQFPNICEAPPLPYAHLGSEHVLYDLIYNPTETAFLRMGKEHGAQVQNGYAMLCLQAEASWSIWQNKGRLIP